jgi:hypothetical protein
LNNPVDKVDLEMKNNLANQPEDLMASRLDRVASSPPHKKTYASSGNSQNDNFPVETKGRY